MERLGGEVLSLAEQTEREFIKMFDAFNTGSVPERKRADVIDSFWSDIYKIVFKPSPEESCINNSKSKLKTYDIEQIEEVTDMYIKLCKRYGGVIKYNQFCNLTGLHRSTLDIWNKANNTSGYIFKLSNNDILSEDSMIIIYNNGGSNNIKYGGNRCKSNDLLSSYRFDVMKKLQREMQDSNTNGLSNDTMGHAIRANNEEDLGKLYEPKRMIQQESIKQQMSITDIQQRLLELSGNKPQLPNSDS